jgi:hypothetical protein
LSHDEGSDGNTNKFRDSFGQGGGKSFSHSASGQSSVGGTNVKKKRARMVILSPHSPPNKKFSSEGVTHNITRKGGKIGIGG